jgi:predicted phage-related endonuclease
MYAADRGVKVRRDAGHHRHRVHHWMVTHLDYRVVKESRLLECKTARWRTKAWGEPGSADIPVHYYTQVQHELAVVGYEAASVPVLFGFNEFAIYDVPRDSEFIDKLIAAEEEFWTLYVETGEPPPVDGSESARRFMQRRWPKDDGTILPATPEQAEIVERYRRAHFNSLQVMTEVERLKNRIIEIIGPAAGLRGPDFEITYKLTKEGKPQTAWESVAGMLRKIIEECPEEVVQEAMETLGARLPGAPVSDELDELIGLFSGPGRKAYRRFEMTDKEAA